MRPINMILNPNDAEARVAIQRLDADLDKMNTLHGPGVVVAQVFPKMLENGGVLGLSMNAVVLDNATGQKIKALLRGAK